MRIVGGDFSGAALVSPKGSSTRPTSDRVREAVFNVLMHGNVATGLSGARVMDLFAGTGALGLEALSRGAASCLFVEHDAGARGVLQRNIEALDVHARAKVFRRDATLLGPAGNKGGMAFVFLDPPYGRGLGERALQGLSAGDWLAPCAIIVLEEKSDVEIAWPGVFQPLDVRSYGDTCVHFARFEPELNPMEKPIGAENRGGRE